MQRQGVKHSDFKFILQTSKALALFAFALINNMLIGTYMVLIGWQAVSLSSDVTIVGRTFMAASITSLALSPLFGYVTDNFERKDVLLKALFARIWMGVIPLAFSVSKIPLPGEYQLYSLVIAQACLTNLCGFALLPIVRASISQDKLTGFFALIAIIRQIGLLIGASLGGYLIHLFDFKIAYLSQSVMGLLSLLIACRFTTSTPLTRTPFKGWTILQALHFKASHHPASDLPFCALLFAFSAALAAFINVLLPGYVQLVLQKPSTFYGLVESAMSLGGIVIGVLLTRIVALDGAAKNNPIIILTAALFAALAFDLNATAYLFIHFILGMAITYTQIIASSGMTRHCDADQLGSYQASVRLLASLCALFVYLLPNLFNVTQFAVSYGLAASVLVCIGVIGWVKTRL